MSEKSPRELILDALIKHPEGLTIVSLAKITGLHRHTSSKYLHELIAAGIIKQRKIGPARLCYLEKKISEDEKKRIVESLEEKWIGKKSQAKLITAILLLSLISVSSLAIASNLFNETISGFEVFPNFSFGNQSAELFNESQEITENESLEPVFPILSKSKINVEIEAPERVNRGEDFKIKAKIENSGFSKLKIFGVKWKFPESFKIISEKTNCQVLEPKSSCFYEILASSSLSSELGPNKVKVVIDYGE